MKHPLTKNPNKHYDVEEGVRTEPAIKTIERQKTIQEVISWCRINVLKYDLRNKGQDESDKEKIKTYIDYIGFLLSVEERVDYFQEKRELSVLECYALLDLRIEY